MGNFFKILLFIINYINIIQNATHKYLRIDENNYLSIKNDSTGNGNCEIKDISGNKVLPIIGSYNCSFRSFTYQNPRLFYDYILKKPKHLVSYDNDNKQIVIFNFDTNDSRIILMDSTRILSKTLEKISIDCAVIISSKFIRSEYLPGAVNYEHKMLFINLTNYNIGKQVILIPDEYFIYSVFFSLLKMRNGLLLLTSFNCLGNYDPINDSGLLDISFDTLTTNLSISFFFVNLTTYSIERKSFFDVDFDYRYISKEKEMKMIELIENGISYIILCYYYQYTTSYYNVMCYSQRYINDNIFLSNKDTLLYYCIKDYPFYLFNMSNIGFIGCEMGGGYEIKKFHANLTTFGSIPKLSGSSAFIPFQNYSVIYFKESDSLNHHINIPECIDDKTIYSNQKYKLLKPDYLPESLTYNINILNVDRDSGINYSNSPFPLDSPIDYSYSESKEVSFEYYLSLSQTEGNFKSKNCIGKIIICYNLCINCYKIGDSNNNNCITCISGYSFNQSSVTGNCIENTKEKYYLNETLLEMLKCYKTCKTCKKGGNYDNHNCLTCNEEQLYYPFEEDYPYNSNEINCYYLLDKIDYRYFNSQTFKKCINGCKICSNDISCIDCDYENDYYLLYNEINHYYECKSYYEQIKLSYYLQGKRLSKGEFKKCYSLCNLCSDSGNINNQNCDSCINGYYHNLLNKKNCECQKYYSSHDPPICYIEYGLSITNCEYIIREILDKGKCVSNCQNTKYKYVYRNQCYEKCPNGTSNILNSYYCQEKNICSLNEYYTNIPLSLIDGDIMKDIALSYFKEFGNENKHVKVIYSNDNSYNITLFSNQLCEIDIFFNYLHKLNISICLEKLKKKTI